MMKGKKKGGGLIYNVKNARPFKIFLGHCGWKGGGGLWNNSMT